MTQSDNSSQTKEKEENTCAESQTAHMLSPTSLRLVVIMIRRALAGAIKLCDELVEQLKTK
jgi:hypothetical protein